MTFRETPRFPTKLALGAEGGPSYVVEVVQLRSGAEQRNLLQDRPRQRYSIAFLNREESEIMELNAYFRACKGQAHPFRFKDPLDFEVTGSDGIVSLIPGSPSGLYQLKKRYTSGSDTEDRTILKPVNPITVAGGGTYSVDYTTGIVTHTGGSAPSGWTGEFDVPVRFDVAAMRAAVVNIGGGQKLGTWDSIELIEVFET
jgi:uncharacterized protein (TIGR02217 family)